MISIVGNLHFIIIIIIIIIGNNISWKKVICWKFKVCRTGGVSYRERQMLVLYLTWG